MPALIFQVRFGYGANNEHKMIRKTYKNYTNTILWTVKKNDIININNYKKEKKAMDDYKFSVGIEPTDAYEKAKCDMLQALESINMLTPIQQRKLAEELLGRAKFESFCQLLGHISR